MRKKIVAWLKKQVSLSQTKGIVLGLSAGIDSCAAASLAKEAAGKLKVLALILPVHSRVQDAQDALAFAKRLGIRTKTINLTEVYDNLLKVLPAGNGLSKMNLKPRLRMLVLYYFANKLNYLVCGTSNKSEIMTGYFTKYGDGASDILPLGDLLKKQVRALGKELGLPQHIINKIPSAGLKPGQTDEGEMGISYAELDDILERLENKRTQILSKDKINKVKGMIKRSEHKRLKPRICSIRDGS